MNRAVAVAIILLAVAGAYHLMWRGWRRRSINQAGVPPLPAPLPPAPTVAGPFDAVYLGTTTAGDWLDRIVAHTLGRRSEATVTVTAARVSVERGPEPGLDISASMLSAARVDRVGAHKRTRSGRLLVLTWRHGDRVLDTAVRPRRQADVAALRDAVTAIIVPEGLRS